MGTIIIKSDKKNTKVLAKLAERLGGKVFDLEDEQLEDILLGMTMDQIKTRERTDREDIMVKLSRK